MKGSRNEVWITSACSKEEAKKCLVLAKSLKASSTNRPTAIFITSGLDPVLRKVLTNTFDHIYVLEEEMLKLDFPLEFHALANLSLLKLHSFEKCVYLAPNSVILRNADQIFDFGDDDMNSNIDLILPKEGAADFMAIFAVRPDLKSYYSRDNLIHNETHLKETMHKYFTANDLEVGYLDDKFCATVKAGGYSIKNSDVCIVTFEDDPLTFVGKDLGILENLAVNLWTRMNNEIELRLTEFSMFMEIAEDGGGYGKEPIAIVGMSCRYPDSNNLDEFWKVLIEGRNCSRMPPPSRFKRNKDQGKIIPGGYLDIPLDEFDSKFFGISPAEVIQMDPQHRLLHEVIWEALEDAGIDATKLNFTNSGVFYGSWKMDFKEILTEAGYTEFYRKYMGNSMGAGAARISFNLGLTGPCIATENGCSSSMAAVHLACKSLASQETNLALACGANLILNPIGINDLKMLLAPDGRCKTLDAKADGYGRAEGLGTLVLKRLSDAVRDGDRIWALIRGSALTQEGVSKSLGTPTVHCESSAMRQALKDANVMPEQVSFVEMHGSGTPTGDPVEVASIAKAYYSPRRKEPLLIGSAKVNLSHTESCSGMVGIMKVALQMKYGIIAPHRNLEELNPAINLNSIPAKVPMEALEWKRTPEGGRRIAGVSSFGITGTDAHLIMEEPPEKCVRFATEFRRPFNILKISAKSREAFDSLLEKYLHHLKSNSRNESTEDICYTGNVGRGDFPFRACVVGNSGPQLISILEKKEAVEAIKIPESRGKICFLFTGQGSQYPGMAKQLYNTSPVFRIHFDYCANLLETQYKVNLREILFWSEEPDANLNRSIYSQTGIFVVEYALFKLWQSWGISPDFCMGHSMGEFAASACAGILSVEDALKLVASRSLLIEERCPPGKMLVIQADQSSVKEIMSGFASGDDSKILDFAALNSPQQTVVSGDPEIIVEFANYLKSEGFRYVVLQANHAFHSKHMDSIKGEYEHVAASVHPSSEAEWKSGYISGLTGKLVKEAREIGPNYWLSHSRQPVNFVEASKTATRLGSTIFLEIGPQPILSALQMMNNSEPTMTITCLASLKKNEDNWTTMLESLRTLYTSGFNVDWVGFDKLYARTKVSLPTYPFIGQKFWPQDLRNLGDKKIIHPLLGSSIPNATSKRIFQVGLNLSELEYLKEHQIGECVVYPGACFLETMLAAGVASFGSNDLRKNRMSLKVENVVIEAPLRLVEDTTSVVQVVVGEAGENGGIPLTIFQIMLEEGDCRQHSRGTIFPLPSEDEREFAMDLEKFEKTKLSAGNDKLAEDTYQKLDALGLRFGETFRSIKKLWDVDGDDAILLAKVKLPRDNRKDYIIHPVIIDAMLQAIMMLSHGESLKKKIFLPVRVGKFVWLGGENVEMNDEDLYIHVFNSDSAVLVTSTGSPIAIMSQVDLMDTTVSSVTSILEQQTSKLPTLWEEVWKGASGTMKDRLNFDTIPDKFYSDEFLERTRNLCNVLREDNLRIWKLLHQFVYLNMLKGLYACGWKVEEENEIDLEMLIESLGILEKHKRIVGFFLTVFEEEGFLEKVGESKWKVRRKLPSSEQVGEVLSSSVFSEELVQTFESTKLLEVVGDNLGGILRGDKDPLSILFPDSFQNYPSVHQLYEEYASLVQGAELVAQVVEERVNFWKEQMSGQNFVLRIIEFGSGTGCYTQIWIDALEKLGLEYEFYYTDISPAFFPAAEIKFEKYRGKMRFKRFNLEEDPLSQGFLPEYFDYAVASETIHATRNIRESLGNVLKILRTGASFDIFEQTKVNRVLSYLFGCLDGFWRFEDFDLRQSHCTMSADEWKRAFQEAGYSFTQVFHCCNDSHGLICAQKKQEMQILEDPIRKEENIWIIFKPKGDPSSLVENLIKKLRTACHRRVIVVEPGMNYSENWNDGYTIRDNSKEDFERILDKILPNPSFIPEGIVYAWALEPSSAHSTSQLLLQPYLNLIQSLSKFNTTQRLVVLTSGVCPLREQSLSGCFQSSLWGVTKSLLNEDFEANCRCIDVSEATFTELFHEVWNTAKRDNQVFLSSDNLRFTPKLQTITSHNNSLSLPRRTDRFHCILPESRQIADLAFAPLNNFTLLSCQVEVEVRAVGLNFRDIFAVLKPSEYFQSVNTIGFDVAGVVKRVGSSSGKKWRAGDRVFWMAGDSSASLAFPSHLVADELDLARIPEGVSFAEAATLPSCFITAYVSLVEVANVKPSDTLLIHTGSGGVGLACIEVCKYLGVPLQNIICTVGSSRKRTFLQQSYGIVHVFNSRNIDYSSNILELTGGNGVNVVVNTLTSKGFKEATLQCVAKRGRFIELSKLNVWSDEVVLEMRPDVKYKIVDVSSAIGMEDCSRLLEILVQLLSNNSISPLPYSRFDGVDLRQGLEFLQKAKQIGKVVCVMPQHKSVEGRKASLNSPMFHENGTYLITGGLGGIGFEVAKWMLRQGARHLLLIGRTSPKEGVQREIGKLSEEGEAHIVTVRVDVSNYAQLRSLLENLSSLELPPLKGVMHSAGALADGLIPTFEWERFSIPFQAKVDGTLNLHKLTKNIKLEHFVLFSSVVALLGTPGQSNHAAGNCFEDSFAHLRHSLGLPVTTVNWGAWAEIGAAAQLVFPGLKGMSTEQGLAALEFALKSQRTQICALNISSFEKLMKWLPSAEHYLDKEGRRSREEHNSSAPATSVAESSAFWNKYNGIEKKEEKLKVITGSVQWILRKILKLSERDVIGEEVGFAELGLDSLMFLELNNELRRLVGSKIVLNVRAIRDADCIRMLTTTMFNLLEGDEAALDALRPPTYEQVATLMREDCLLPQHIRAKSQQILARGIGNVKHVLLTGGTGTLGPYVLRELCKLTQIESVYCVVRRRKTETVANRLKKWLEGNKSLILDSVAIMSKVIAVEGDVTLAHLGMEESDWSELSEKVDAVFHCAAHVDHVEYYRPKARARAVNIQGTINILEFAGSGDKLKHVYYASTLMACGSRRSPRGTLIEEWPQERDFDNVTIFAYPVSKFCAEMLVKEACVERGIPCKSFRFPLVTGDSSTGQFAIDQNHFMLRYFYMMKTGVMPSLPFPVALLPVDICARVSVQLFFNSEAPPDVYNVMHPLPNCDEEFIALAKKFGKQIRMVDFGQFTQRLREETDDKTQITLFRELYNDDDVYMTHYNALLEGWLDKKEDFWRSKKVEKFLPDFLPSLESTLEYLEKDLKFAKKEGFFDRLGL